jgi:hypothetical protein
MLETILLSGIFMVTLVIGLVVLVNNYKKVTDERDKHYRSEMKHIRDEVVSLKGIIKEEMITIINKIKNEKILGKDRND